MSSAKLTKNSALELARLVGVLVLDCSSSAWKRISNEYLAWSTAHGRPWCRVVARKSKSGVWYGDIGFDMSHCTWCLTNDAVEEVRTAYEETDGLARRSFISSGVNVIWIDGMPWDEAHCLAHRIYELAMACCPKEPAP